MPKFNATLIPAMVTPFTPDGQIDFDAMGKLAVYLTENGCDGLLVNGTTGESPTLSFEEKVEAVKCVMAAVRGKNIPVMTGAGGNDTAKTIKEAKAMADLGVDALLIVVPYYNKPTQAGMLAHFGAVAEAVPGTEIVIYNIPSRSVVRMAVETMQALNAKHSNIIGVKQSHPCMDAVSEIANHLPAANWFTWCGDDTLTLPMMACGAHGTFSVLAHLAGNPMREMIDAVKKGDFDKARSIHLKLLNPGRDIFNLPNPTIVKTCLSKLGHVGPTLRLPMVPPTAEEMKWVDTVLAEVKAYQPQRV